MKIKTSELEGAALDWAVGMAEDGGCIVCQGSVPRWKFPGLEASVWAGDLELGDIERWSPSTDWSQGGPLIEEFNVSTFRIDSETIGAEFEHRYMQYESQTADAYGSTPLISAMRAIVAAKLGDTVDVPDELL